MMPNNFILNLDWKFSLFWLYVYIIKVFLNNIGALKPHVFLFLHEIFWLLAMCVRIPSFQTRAMAIHVIFSTVDMFVKIFFLFTRKSLQQETPKFGSIFFLWGEFPVNVCCCIVLLHVVCWFLTSVLQMGCSPRTFFYLLSCISKVISCGLVTQCALQQQIRVF